MLLSAPEEAITLSKHAKKVGADGLLIATPYYNKPTQEGLYQHFKAIHDAVDHPIILYNIPGRSIVDLEDQTICRLAALPNIIGLKDATGDLARVPSFLAEYDHHKPFTLLSGEDSTAVSFNAAGGSGVVSVTANIAPKAIKDIQTLCKDQQYQAAMEQQITLEPLHQALFRETSPGPAKYAASLMGWMENNLRLPLVPIAKSTESIVSDAMIRQGII